ncbi:MAG: response regulator [Deltaproteobacteria bacterium]|nr:response regulator [Deltaproteobacteria bacterium]
MGSVINQGLTISILVVEDEAIALLYLVTTLAKKYPNVMIHKAANGRAGLELFKTHMPEIVITDINMPEMGGAQMAEKIREIKPDTKFIVLTGFSGKPGEENSIGNGFENDHCIVKPIIFKELFDAIEQCVGCIHQ